MAGCAGRDSSPCSLPRCRTSAAPVAGLLRAADHRARTRRPAWRRDLQSPLAGIPRPALTSSTRSTAGRIVAVLSLQVLRFRLEESPHDRRRLFPEAGFRLQLLSPLLGQPVEA